MGGTDVSNRTCAGKKNVLCWADKAVVRFEEHFTQPHLHVTVLATVITV